MLKEQSLEYSFLPFAHTDTFVCISAKYFWKEPKETGDLFSREESQVATLVTFYSIVLFEFFHVNALTVQQKF